VGSSARYRRARSVAAGLPCAVFPSADQVPSRSMLAGCVRARVVAPYAGHRLLTGRQRTCYLDRWTLRTDQLHRAHHDRIMETSVPFYVPGTTITSDAGKLSVRSRCARGATVSSEASGYSAQRVALLVGADF